MAKRVHNAITRHNAEMLVAGVREGKPYDEIGRMYKPPVSGSCAYKHARKMIMPNGKPLCDFHPRRGKRKGPYTQNPIEMFQ